MNWAQLAKDELIQRHQEGCDLSSVGADPDDVNGPEAWPKFVAALDKAGKRDDYLYDEPADLEEIRRLRRSAEHRYSLTSVKGQLPDRLLGGWLGRTAGCLLGKPVEGWSRRDILSYMQATGVDEDRVEDYLPLAEPDDNVRHPESEWLRGQVDAMPRDDDLDYTILGLRLLETRGRDFTTEDVGALWLESLPYRKVYTAERSAYRNLVDGLRPPDCAAYANPYREYIGAQIRADAFGYASPGRPSAAAALAWRDARLSHTKNGIYGEMFVAATIAAAFVATDPREALYIGISETPDTCRLNEAVRYCLDLHRLGRTWTDAVDAIAGRYGEYSWVHTINNACVVALALLYGERDFGRTIGLAVACGWDTDCNGATCGSIVGVMNGAGSIPQEWIAPLNDRIHSCVFGFDNARISDLAARTLAVAET